MQEDMDKPCGKGMVVNFLPTSEAKARHHASKETCNNEDHFEGECTNEAMFTK